MLTRDSGGHWPGSSPGRQRYSRHYLNQKPPAVDADSPDCPILSNEADASADLPIAESQSQRRSLWPSIGGLLSLVGLIWLIAEPLHSTFKADAQDSAAPVETVAPAPQTPWQSASFPVEDFVAYTSPFGYRNHPYGGRRFHYGLDMAAPMGSYIRAWWEGTVVEVSDDTACGTSVVIESKGWLHIYCHMQGYIVIETDGDRWMVDRDGGVQIRQGDLVKTGQRIGRVGMTGSTTGPHLHWGMKYQGNWIDPTVVIKAMVGS